MDEKEPKWPIVMQADDPILRVVDRHEWTIDVDLHYYAEPNLIFDAEGGLWTRSRDARQGQINLVPVGRSIDEARMLELAELDPRADPLEVAGFGPRTFFAYVEGLDRKFASVAASEAMRRLPGGELAAHSNQATCWNANGAFVAVLHLPWFHRGRARASREALIASLRATGSCYLTCEVEPSGEVQGYAWTRVGDSAWRVPDDLATSDLIAWLGTDAWCLARDRPVPYEFDHPLELFRRFARGATTFVAASPAYWCVAFKETDAA